MDMPIITAFETRASRDFCRLIQGIITLRVRNWTLWEVLAANTQKNIKLLRIFYEKQPIVLKKRIIKNNYFENFVEFIAFYIFMM